MTVLAPLLLATLTVAGPADAAAAPSPRYLDCAALPGAGTYANPSVIGSITMPTVVQNCPPLASGAAYAVRYFRFNLPKQPSASSAVLTYYQLRTTAQSGVHPCLLWSPWTVKDSLGTGYQDAKGYKGFYHPMSDLWAGTGWLIGAEKLSSPLGSVQTAPYNVLLTP
jgi:hypothetical protein